VTDADPGPAGDPARSPTGGPGAAGAAGGRVGELAGLFLRLGVTAFGGPAGHIAMMHDEVVRRRGWVSDERFVDLIGATNLIPGPNSTELAIYLGWDRARGRGLVVAGVCFIAPAAVIVGTLAWVYVTYGDTLALGGVLYGIKPVVIAVIVQALLKLGPTVAKTVLLGVIAAAALAAYLAGVNELVVLAGGGLLTAGLHVARSARTRRLSVWLPLPLLPSLAALGSQSGEVGLGQLFLVWITEQQLLDAISIGQVTPGPVFTTATFVGYLTAGGWGTVVATIGIFLPSFVFVALLTHLVEWMRASPTLGAVLDGVNAAAVALIAGVSLHLAGDAVVDILTLVIAAAAGVALWRTRVNSAWLVAGGAAIGVVHALVR
jgi:chromate transporter